MICYCYDTGVSDVMYVLVDVYRVGGTRMTGLFSVCLLWHKYES